MGWCQCHFQFVEESWKDFVQVVINRKRDRLGKPNRNRPAIHMDQIVAVVALDEITRSLDGGGIDNRVEKVWIETKGVFVHCPAEKTIHREHPKVSEGCILLDKILQQVIEIPK